MKNAVLSVDFFDTLVCRLCNHPTDLFYEVGQRLASSQLLLQDISPSQFKSMRIAAEAKARQTGFWENGSTEIGLQHIYAKMDGSIIRNVDAAMDIELQVEKEFCFVNPGVNSLIQYALSLGHRVCVLSDMYLRSDSLRQIAAHNGMNVSQLSLILTSSEQLQGKSSGGLFAVALHKLNSTPDQMLHLGDNVLADVQGAQKAGLRGFHYLPESDFARSVFLAEKRHQARSKGSFGSNAVRTMVQRSSAKSDDHHLTIGQLIIGPVLSNWADWCVFHLQQMGINEVFAFMREGRLLAKMLQNSAKAQGVPLKISELFVSRQSTHLASVGEATIHTIPERIYARTVGEVFESFGVSAAESGFPPNIANRSIESPELLHTIVRFITSGNIRKTVEARSETARKQFLSYFLPQIETGCIAVVDLGWGGTIQRNINRIFQLENIPVQTHGFYLATSQMAANQFLNGMSFSSFLCQIGDFEQFSRTLIRSPEMIEQSISANVGSTIGYAQDTAGNWHPVLETVTTSDEELRWRKNVQAGILEYQTHWLELAAAKRIFTYNGAGTHFANPATASRAEESRAIIERFIAYPTPAEANVMGQFHHDDGVYSNRRRRIVEPEKIALLENQGYATIVTAGTLWPQGTLSQAIPGLTQLLSAGTEIPEELHASLKALHLMEQQHRHPEIQASHIVRIEFSSGVWMVYSLTIECPHCNHPMQEQLIGTYTVLKTICCTKCGELWSLCYDAIDAYLQQNRPELLGGPMLAANAKAATLRKRISDSFSVPDTIPLLATISNNYTNYCISKMVCDELVQERSPK